MKLSKIKFESSRAEMNTLHAVKPYIYLQQQTKLNAAITADVYFIPRGEYLIYKKEEMTKGRKAGRASKTKPGPFLSSRSGSATSKR